MLGALAIALGAFGAHALKQIIDEKSLSIFETGVRYQYYHVVALCITAIVYKDFPHRLLQWAGRSFGVGIVLFSGSLYALALANLSANPGLKWIGAITPLGGLCFIIGWVLLGVGVAKQ